MQDTPPDTLRSLAMDQWSILDLLSQAGGFQWPILAVLVLGLLALSLAGVRLFMDHREAQPLYALDIGGMGVEDIATALARARDTLLGRLLAGMLAVWRSAPESSALGHESRTVMEAARAAYTRTQRMVGFLSSTAGGLGLLGTLVGIYALFSAETRDAQTIFAGIAIAIVSTLLGIIVSIILEALEALTHRWGEQVHGGGRGVVRLGAVPLAGPETGRGMKQSLIVRLVDITLLLLLSLMAIASIDPYSVTPPQSDLIKSTGAVLDPLTVALTPDGDLQAHTEGGLVSITPQALASYARSAEQVIEVVADHRALASALLDLHRVLEAAGVRSVFMVQPIPPHR